MTRTTDGQRSDRELLQACPECDSANIELETATEVTRDV